VPSCVCSVFTNRGIIWTIGGWRMERDTSKKGSVVCSEKMHVDPVFLGVSSLFGLETSGSGDWV
jgi:hypothetical protein